MKDQSFATRKLSPAIGAELIDADLLAVLSDEGLAAIRQALLDNLVIFFRNQNLTPGLQKAAGQRFGKLHIHPAPLGVVEGHPEVLAIKTDENSRKIAGEDWHSDVSCDDEPPMGTILYVKEVPPVGGDTLFASMYAAYEALSDSMRRLLNGLTAIHDGARNYEGRQPVAGQGSSFPHAEHPVVRTHPETGRQALYINRMFTTRVVQLKPNESDALLQMLFRHIENPVFQCRFRWQADSVAFWDNRCVQHMALWDYYPHRRLGTRVTIAGAKPFYRP
ncbi:MAG: TauD/TfdA family dioxygenase [Candidatus Binataceae bacterium]|jgi:taurine dioxygenase